MASPPSPSAVAPASDVAPGSPQALAASALGFGPQAYPWIQALQQRLEAAGLSDITDIHLEAVCCRAWHEANHPGAVHVWQNLLRSWVQRTIRHPLPDQYQEEESAPAPTGPVDLAEEESGISAFDAMREAALGRLGEATWQRWFQPLWARPVSDGVLPIICPDGFSRDWFHDRLDGVVRECLLSAGFPALTPSYEEAP